MTGTGRRFLRIDLVTLAIVLALGIFLRIPSQAFFPGASLHRIAALHPQAGFNQIGFDENLYRKYVEALIKGGIASYPDVVEDYIALQKSLPTAILPPLRFLYIFTAYLWQSSFHCDALYALHCVSSFFCVLTLCLAVVFTWRIRGSTWALGVAALMAVAPTQIHMSQHALIDGVFAFWALLCLWLLWENLQSPRDWRLLAIYGLALALMVVTKENSAFAWLGLIALLVANRWLKFGANTRELWLASAAGPLLGLVILAFLAGGLSNVVSAYQLLVNRASQTPYALLTGDGPWYRYFVDLLLVSPLILILALAGIFRLDGTRKPELFMSIFIGASYLAMCNVKYGMNLRYANMWDMPLRLLALSGLASLMAPLGRYRAFALVAAVTLVCGLELRQYIILAVQFPLYELVPEGLLRALHILKSP